MTYRRFDKGVISPGTAPSEQSVLMLPRAFTFDGSKRAVIWCHGHNGDATTLTVSNLQFVDGAMAAALALGLPVLSIDAGGPATFGNDASIARITEAVAYVETQKIGRADGVVLMGSSMGTMDTLNYAARTPAKVRALGLMYPAMDLAYPHDVSGFGTAIDAAYTNNAGYQAAYATHDGLSQARAGALNGLRIRGWYASNDTTVGPNTWASFQAALAQGGAPKAGEFNLGPVGHGDDTLLPTSDVASWLQLIA